MIKIDGSWFVDEHGRRCILRGANFSGSSKMPTKEMPTISFVGRPCSLDTADEHFRRLKSWGLTFLRYAVTWEAIEHAGPGIYDEDYLDFTAQVIAKAGEHGLFLFIDIHQDVWGRKSDGDGAPEWTYRKVGLNPDAFVETGAAEGNPANLHMKFGKWPANYTKFASSTMFTLFYGGNDFAPETMIDGVPVQEFLQGHYINAVSQLARRIKDMPHVIGFGTMNEPSSGYIGWGNLNETNGTIHLRKGLTPTPVEGMALATGIPQKVAVWGIGPFGPMMWRRKTVNEDRVSLWLDGFEPIWLSHGVWAPTDDDGTRVLQPEYFTSAHGRPIDFGRDYLRPFINLYAQALHDIRPDWLIFAQNTPMLTLPKWGPNDASNIVNASHWYDYTTIGLRFFIPFFNINVQTSQPIIGYKNIIKSFKDEIGLIKQNSEKELGGVPTLLGEFGIPFNMPLKLNLYLNWFGNQVLGLDASFKGVEGTLVSGTIWNYTPDNTNKLGDHWNEENLSVFSLSQQKNPQDINSGGRALDAVVRPYPKAVAGEPLNYQFSRKKKNFELSFKDDPTITEPTEVFVPTWQYPDGIEVALSDGRYEYDRESQILRYYHCTGSRVHYLFVSPKSK